MVTTEPRVLRGQVLVVLQGFGNPVRTGLDGIFRLFLYEAMIREASERSKEQVATGGQPRDVEMGRYVSEWARRYGLEAHQGMAEVGRTRGDERTLALAAFARDGYAAVVDRAGSAAERKLQQPAWL